MAIIHQASLTPTKRELLSTWLDTQPWAGSGAVEIVGSYRYDDPEGEVGVEAMVVRRGDALVHVPMTYRGAPLPGADEHLIGTGQHSVLGSRWVYDAVGDPVAVGCFVRALRGEQAQAELEVWGAGHLVERRLSAIHVHAEDGGPVAGSALSVATDVDGARLTLARVLGSDLDGPRRLAAEWADGSGVVATLS